MNSSRARVGRKAARQRRSPRRRRGHAASRSSAGQRGFLLVEALIYIAMLAFVSTLAVTTFLKGLSISQDLKRNARDIVRVLKAGEQWRSDIRTSVGPPQLVRDESSVALEIPGSNGLLVYLFHHGSVWRRSEGEDWSEFLTGLKTSEMKRDVRKATVSWEWNVELTTRKQIVRVSPLFSFRAVEGGHRIDPTEGAGGEVLRSTE